jgi:hypothetical protein
MRYSKAGEHLTIAEAERRALMAMAGMPTGCPVSPSWVGQHMWPLNRMRAQGLGGAASRVLNGLVKKGLVRQVQGWTEFWGYCLTGEGRVAAAAAAEAARAGTAGAAVAGSPATGGK